MPPDGAVGESRVMQAAPSGPGVTLKGALVLAAFLATAAVGRAQSPGNTLQEALDEPGGATRAVALCDSFEASGQLALALESLRAAARALPDTPFLLARLGSLLVAMGRHQEATETYRHLLALDPGSLDARYGLVRIAHALGDWERVQALCAEILAKNGENTFALVETAWSLFCRKEYREAMKYYEDPHHASTRAMRLGAAWCWLRLGDHEGARSLFAALVRERPHDVEARAGLARGERAAIGWALPRFELPGRLSAGRAASYLDLARRLKDLGELRAAGDLAGYVVSSDPANIEAALEAAGLCLALGEWEQASRLYARVLEGRPDEAARRGRIEALANLGLRDEADRLARALLEARPADPLALSTCAHRAFVSGDFRSAADLYRKAGPEPRMRQGLAWSLLLTGAYDQARAVFEEIVARSPSDACAHEGLLAAERAGGRGAEGSGGGASTRPSLRTQ